jgi:hypothetical protein
MKPITKAAWNRVIDKACDVANATRVDDDPMYDVYRQQMIEILDELEAEYGEHSRIFDTRADYVDDPNESRRLRTNALELAKKQNNQEEIEIIQQTMRDFEEDSLADSKPESK